MEDVLISIVMPAYNVGRYIKYAIDSVLDQSYDKWELIIVNDCSKDNTRDVVREYKDNRIILVDRSSNSGSAYMPREDAIKIAKGKWIINLDADDYIERDYLKKLINKAKKIQADIVGPQMVLVNEIGEKQRILAPSNDFNFDKAYSGREAVNLTLPVWNIGMNGALIKRDLWVNSLAQYSKTGKREIHDDENLTRVLLINANVVGTDQSQYYLRSNPLSVTRTFKLSTFGWMKSNDELQNIISNAYGKESPEYEKVSIYDYYCFRDVTSSFMRTKTDFNTFMISLKLIKKWHDRIKWGAVISNEPILKNKVYKNIIVLLTCLVIKNCNISFCRNSLKVLFKKAKEEISNNKYYMWYFTRKERERNIREKLKSYYNREVTISSSSKDEFVICIYDGAVQSGGLADRLKGIVGTYYISKIKKLPFKIYFKYPFPLEDFLCPNLYNWMTDKSQICKNMCEADIIILDNTQDSRYQIVKQQRYLDERIKVNGKQKHVYTNASFAYDLNYSELFNELFKPSERLQNSIDKQKQLIGSNYISVSCRFLDLLGDFNETHGHGEALSAIDKNELLEKIDSVVEKLHFFNPDKKILINSDSVTFLDRYRDCEYAYVIDGNVTHIDAKQDRYSYEKYEKTFLDFMMIANACEVYLIKSPLMHMSGYPYAASKIYGKKFSIIEI